MPKKSNYLENLLEQLLFEADPVERPSSISDITAPVKKDYSLDQAVDRYIVQYERESIPTSEMYESSNLSKLTKYLFEQEEPEADPAAEEPAGGGLDLSGGADAGAAGPDVGGAGLDLDLGSAGGGPETTGEEPPAIVQTPKINLQNFARSIARLTNNVQSLIDLKSLILNRAEKYVQNNYDAATAKELVDILERSYDLKAVDQSDQSMESEKYPQPRTAVTGPAGG